MDTATSKKPLRKMSDLTDLEAEMLMKCLNAQWRQKKKDAEVQFMVKGSYAQKKRLAGAKSPWGHAIAEVEDGALCVFKADEVLVFISQGGAA